MELRFRTRAQAYMQIDVMSNTSTYRLRIECANETHHLLFGEILPFSPKGFTFAVDRWQETRLLVWGCAAVAIANNAYIGERVETLNAHPHACIPEARVSMIPQEIVAELLLEGILL